MSGAYYNEIDAYCVQWLRNLIAAGLIPDGDVDNRSIEVVQPDDLKGYTQCHFFAGLGGWAYATRLAGWPDGRPIWTGSCPCQPFSVAGIMEGVDDPRHLWPNLFRLIRARRPPVAMGEQVAGEAGYGWFDGVASDLESEGYSARAVDIPACSIDKAHRRNRIYWVSDTKGSKARSAEPSNSNRKEGQGEARRPPSHRRFTCSDGRTYRIPEPPYAFVVDGFPGIVHQISAFGNAIVPELAAEVIMAYMDAVDRVVR